MKLFQSIQKGFAVLGIQSPQLDEKPSFNIKFFIILILIFMHFVFNLKFLLFIAQDFEEFVNIFHALIMGFIIIMNEMLIIWKSKKIFKFISSFESFIEKSESIWISRNYKMNWIPVWFARTEKCTFKSNLQQIQPTSGKVVRFYLLWMHKTHGKLYDLADMFL